MPRSPDDETLLHLARTVTGISTRTAGRLGGNSVTQLRALTVIAAAGSARTGLLAAEFGVSASSASRLTDRREVRLRLTPVGQELLERYDELRLAELRSLLDAVPGRSDVLDALVQLVGGRRPTEATR